MVNRPALLQLYPLSPELDRGLASRFEIHRLHEIAHPDVWLAAHGGAIRAVVTGGHLGISNAMISHLPNLEIVAINGVGFDKVDLEFARRRGVRVTSTPNVLTEDVADLAIGLIISLLRGVAAGDEHVRRGRWPTAERPLGQKVSGRRFGVVGLGRIGLAIADRLKVFGPVSYTGPNPKPVAYPYVSSLHDLARTCDVLVLACAANPATFHMVDAGVLERLGPEGYLINVGRGSLVDQTALVAAVTAGGIAGAGLDVFEAEPDVPEVLRSAANVVLTPHIASATVQTRRAMGQLVLDNLVAHFDGLPLPTALV